MYKQTNHVCDFITLNYTSMTHCVGILWRTVAFYSDLTRITVSDTRLSTRDKNHAKLNEKRKKKKKNGEREKKKYLHAHVPQRINLRLFSWLCIHDFFSLSKSHSRTLSLSLSLSFSPNLTNAFLSFSLSYTHARIFALQRNFVQLSVGSRVHASHPVNDTIPPLVVLVLTELCSRSMLEDARSRSA